MIGKNISKYPKHGIDRLRNGQLQRRCASLARPNGIAAPKDLQEVRKWLIGRSVSETLHKIIIIKKNINTTFGQNLTPTKTSFVKISSFRSVYAIIDHV